SLQKGTCITLDSMPDGLAFVAATKEVWVTTPGDDTIVVLDASKPEALTARTKFRLEGAPEGFAGDGTRGVFYTNLEDKDRTLAIDLHTHAVTKNWAPGCGEAGPRGLAVAEGSDFLVVACTDHVVVLDAGHDGRPLSRIDTGEGVDNIDY